MASLHEQLFEVINEEATQTSNNKVTVVGIGAVGMAAAFSILAQVRSNLHQYVNCISLMKFFIINYRMCRMMSHLLICLRAN